MIFKNFTARLNSNKYYFEMKVIEHLTTLGNLVKFFKGYNILSEQLYSSLAGSINSLRFLLKEHGEEM
jgi:hypothetical protein